MLKDRYLTAASGLIGTPGYWSLAGLVALTHRRVYLVVGPTPGDGKRYTGTTIRIVARSRTGGLLLDRLVPAETALGALRIHLDGLDVSGTLPDSIGSSRYDSGSREHSPGGPRWDPGSLNEHALAVEAATGPALDAAVATESSAAEYLRKMNEMAAAEHARRV